MVFNMFNMHQRQHAGPEPEACGTGHNATVTLEPEPSNIYQPKFLCPSSTTPSTDTSQTTTPMARRLGRTQTLAHIEITDSSVNTPVHDASGAMAPSPSILQHRENSAVIDVDGQHHGKAPRMDEDSDIQTTVGPQQISKPKSQTLNLRQPALSTIRAPTSRLARTKPAAARTIAPRFPSPASTVPEDPDPEYIFNQLAKHHIKIRDFAQCPPYTIGASLLDDSVSTPASALPHCENSSKIVHPISSACVLFPPETFDPYKALGEFEFRLRQRPRILPIGGKTLRRLIEIGWVTENEIESRCSESDLENLENYDSRNRMRLLKLTALREQREKEFGTATPTSIPVGLNNETMKPGTGLLINEGYTSTGAYPYVTLPSETVPTFAERDALIRSLRPHFNVTDRVIRMGLAMERERQRDMEAEALIRMRREDEAERKRVECEVLLPNEEMDEDLLNSSAPTTGPVTPAVLQPAAEITSFSPRAANPRKRSPHDAWADEENHLKDNNSELEPKRSRLARSQSETWYEQQRRQQQSPSGRFKDSHPRPHSHSPRKGITVSFEARNNLNLQSHSQQTHTRCQSRNQTSPFTPPQIQYPAPLSTYDPNLYPDAASAIEAQSQQSESQGRRHPHSYRPGTDTPPASDDEGDDDGKKGIMVGRGFGLTEDGEPDMNRPNALKRAPKKGVQRELTRGRTLVQIF